MKYDNNPALTPYAQKLRRNMTKEERHLWYDCLSAFPVRFRRQKVIGPYIVDFYCAEAGLVVELDGSQHFEEEAYRKDRERDAYLENLGMTVLRYTNPQVNREFRAVADDIWNHIFNNRERGK